MEEIDESKHVASSRSDFSRVLLDLLGTLVAEELAHLLICGLKAADFYEVDKGTPVIVSQALQL